MYDLTIQSKPRVATQALFRSMIDIEFFFKLVKAEDFLLFIVKQVNVSAAARKKAVMTYEQFCEHKLSVKVVVPPNFSPKPLTFRNK